MKRLITFLNTQRGEDMSYNSYAEILLHAEKSDLKPFDWFTLRGPMSLNGYAVLPPELPVDYMDDMYDKIDQSPIGGLTFGGYAFLYDDQLSIARLNDSAECDPLKKLSVPVIGFDNNHIWTNELTAEEGAKYLSNLLKQLMNKKER